MDVKQFIQELELEMALEEVFACELPQVFEKFSPLEPKKEHEKILCPLTTEEEKLLCASTLMSEGSRKKIIDAILWRHIFVRLGYLIPKGAITILRKEGVCLP